MRYLRTKDGRIFDLFTYREDGVINNGIKFVNKINGSFFFIQRDNILKRTHTLQQACDRFVVIYENEEPVPYKNYLDALATQKEVRGAIWTDEGLIYKAKPNNEGDLELL